MPVESFSNLTPVIQFLTALVGLVLALRGFFKKNPPKAQNPAYRPS